MMKGQAELLGYCSQQPLQDGKGPGKEEGFHTFSPCKEGMSYSMEDKLEAFADSMEEQFR